MSDAGLVRLLLFRVGGLVCAADAERVREILPRLEAIRIPGAPPVVAGMVNVRGTLVTVVDGWRALRQPGPPRPSQPTGSPGPPGPARSSGPIQPPQSAGHAEPPQGPLRAATDAGDEAHGGTTVLLEVGGARKVVGLTVDEVVDLLATSAAALEGRSALPGIDPTLVRAVGRRAGQLFVVLDTDALLAPILSS